MRSIADNLALAQSPVSNEDLVLYILTQLGEEHNSIISDVRIRENPVSLGELSDVLTDHERQLKEADSARQSLLATANVAQQTFSSSQNNQSSNSTQRFRNNNSFNRQSWQQRGNNRSSVICKICNFLGHETEVCRKLAKFLKEHNILPMQASTSLQSPTTNSTVGSSQSWLFDSNASHHATLSITHLQTISEYNSPDRLGDGSMNGDIANVGENVNVVYYDPLSC
ncbi:PREDICTED: uncharacterized protein LOC109164067 [Ipomoea nil]|uniref:uncharacterized protein LOC109164067 n=1 Tax=Ipomoea nil TaxID=35883 RepID=UPI000901472B|nr:PREDICTED: uncharacterized protein LOC109164067 [Ipomoea nil]